MNVNWIMLDVVGRVQTEKARIAGLKFGLSGLAWTVVDRKVAEEAGFEPAIRFPVCTLSKRVP
jgi:hypothetical protein